MPGFSGQGVVSIAERLPSGLPGIFRDFGNADVFKISLTEETVERNESMTGQRLPYRKMTKSRGGTLNLKGDEFNAKNFALAVIGKIIDVTAGAPVSGWVMPTGLAVGDTVALPGKNVSGVVVKDSTAGTAKTLDDGDNYTLDPLSGEVKIVNLTTGGPYTQPLKADYTPGAVRVIGAFQETSKEFFVRMKGINTDTGERGVTDVFRIKINPTKALDLINQDFLDWDLDCEILGDLTRQTDDPGGQFFSFTTAAA